MDGFAMRTVVIALIIGSVAQICVMSTLIETICICEDAVGRWQSPEIGNFCVYQVYNGSKDVRVGLVTGDGLFVSMSYIEMIETNPSSGLSFRSYGHCAVETVGPSLPSTTFFWTANLSRGQPECYRETSYTVRSEFKRYCEKSEWQSAKSCPI